MINEYFENVKQVKCTLKKATLLNSSRNFFMCVE